MKKITLKISILVFIMTSISISAQGIKGQAYYQTKRNIDLNLEGSDMSDEQKNMINKRNY